MAVYAAYGSNLNPEQMRLRCPHSPGVGAGWLIGWRLTFGGGDDIGWEGALATLVEDAGAQVFVMTYDLTDEDAAELDRWEGVDLELYRKIRLRVQTLDGEPLAWTYVLNAYEGGLPSARYLGLIADAAERAGAPDDYVRELRGRPCNGVDGR
ncbi:MAG: hypothetical protein QOE24_3094 [Frankiales bacterium]|jgi:hypothetical protein|nr:hypothetical protein [Frankiales bacterium]MDX6210703.1 hypothetical protein [Frankiales bacterium]MDX6222536.1 hypothetical protein [Frankiales bacterium]